MKTFKNLENEINRYADLEKTYSRYDMTLAEAQQIFAELGNDLANLLFFCFQLVFARGIKAGKNKNGGVKK